MWVLLVVQLWLLSLGRGVAAADAAELPRERERATVGGSLSYFTDSQPATNLHLGVLELSVAYGIDDRFSLALDYGIALLATSADVGEGEDALVGANPTAYVEYQPKAVPDLYLGAGFAVPLARGGDDASARVRRNAYNRAAAARGLRRIWLWAPDRAAALLSARFLRALAPELELEAQLQPALLWRVTPNASGDPTDFFVPSSLGLVFGQGVIKPGIRFGAVWLLTNEIDRAQLSLEPLISFRRERFVAELRILINLDEPVAGELGPGMWALQLAAGGVL